MSEEIARLYRDALKRQPSAARLEALQLQALAEGGAASDDALDRLSLDPDATALLAFARELAQESKLLALELRRADAVARSWSRPRRRRLALAAAAALATLALLLPQAVMDSQPGAELALSDAALDVDRDVILSSSFERRKSGESERSDNGNAAIFTGRFDG